MIIDLDEARRPRGHKHDPEALTPAQRQLGRHLVDVHNGYRQEMRQVQDALDQVAAGALDAAALLTRLDEACVELVAGDTGLDRVRAEAERLSAVLSSHFAYEEEELVEPIGRLDVRI